MGVSLAETTELAKLAREAGVRNVIGLQRRFAPGVRHLRKLLAEGYIGKLRSIDVSGSLPLLGARRAASMAFTADIANGTNTLHTMTAHFLDTAIAGVDELESFSALVTRQFSETILEPTGEKVPVTAPDQVIVAGTLRSGAVLSLRSEAGKRNGTAFSWTFTGTEGDLALGGDLTLRGARGDGQSLAPIEVPADPELPSFGGLSGEALAMANLYRDFAADRPLVPNFDDAVRFRRLLDAFIESSETGRRIDWAGR